MCIVHHFNPKLTSNLFLFLSDEICYYSFSNFMKNRKSDNFYICLYTQIMKFKYKFSLEGDYFKIFDDAKALYENYFSEKANNSYMNQDLLFHVRSSVKKLINTNECQYYIKTLIDKINLSGQQEEERALLIGILQMHIIECPNEQCLTKTMEKIFLLVNGQRRESLLQQ